MIPIIKKHKVNTNRGEIKVLVGNKLSDKKKQALHIVILNKCFKEKYTKDINLSFQ